MSENIDTQLTAAAAVRSADGDVVTAIGYDNEELRAQ